MGAGNGCEGGAPVDSADEDALGQLHAGDAGNPAEHRAGEEAGGVSGIHRGARTGAPARAIAQPALHLAHEQLPATVARHSRPA